MTKIWTEGKTEIFRYDLKEKIKISEISEFSILPYTQDRKLGNLGNFFLPWIMTLIIIQDLKIPKKSIETKLKGSNMI